jgi:hypothetical protein
LVVGSIPTQGAIISLFFIALGDFNRVICPLWWLRRRALSPREPQITEGPSGEALAVGARFSESIARLAKSTFVPKGVYRFKAHDEAANQHQEKCLAQGMAMLAAMRNRDR